MQYSHVNNKKAADLSPNCPAALNSKQSLVKEMITMNGNISNIVNIDNNINNLVIANTQIRQDSEGRYCLNDCHRASGFDKSKQPSNWLRLDTTSALIAEIRHSSYLRTDPISTINGGINPGTYVVKELVYAYAMWISPAFHLQVIRAYDDLVQGKYQPVVDLNDPAFLRNTLITYTEKCMKLEEENKELKPKVEAFDRLALSDGMFSVTEAAKMLNVPRNKLFAYLYEKGWIFRWHGCGRWTAYASKTKSGDLFMKPNTVSNIHGESKTVEELKVTPKGLAKLAELFSQQSVA